jgi:hypothetical protein
VLANCRTEPSQNAAIVPPGCSLPRLTAVKRTTWRFFLGGDLVQTVSGRDSDLRGIAFGSFADWQHVASDIFYARLRIGMPSKSL